LSPPTPSPSVCFACHPREGTGDSPADRAYSVNDIPTAKVHLPAALNGADPLRVDGLPGSICWSNGCVTSVIFHSGCWYRAKLTLRGTTR
jgi:hypothetical protein